MLSKKEIEKSKECLKETIQNTYAEGKAIKLNNVLKYIDQLESDKQKLIEKLEKIKYDLEFDRRKNNYSYLYDIKEILEIVKGESQVTVK